MSIIKNTAAATGVGAICAGRAVTGVGLQAAAMGCHGAGISLDIVANVARTASDICLGGEQACLLGLETLDTKTERLCAELAAWAAEEELEGCVMEETESPTQPTEADLQMIAELRRALAQQLGVINASPDALDLPDIETETT